MKRVLIGLSVFLCVGILALVLYLAITDFSRYQTDIEAAITEATGREFRIDGEFNPEVFPLSFVAEDISIANTDWGSDVPFLTVGHVSILVDAASLLSGPLRIREFRLHDVALLLEVNAEGEDNWSMAAEEPEFEVHTGDSDGNAVILEFGEVRNVSVTYRVSGAEDRVATIASLDVLANEDGYIEAAAFGQVDDSDLNLTASVGPIDNFDAGANVEFDLESYLGEIAFNVTGNTGDPDTLAGSQLDVALTSDDVATVFNLLNLNADMSGPMRIEAALSPQDGQSVLVVEANAADLEATSELILSNETIEFSASVLPLSRVGEILGVDGMPDAPLSAKGALTRAGTHYELSEAIVELQSVRVELDGTVGLSSDTPTELAIAFSSSNLEEISSDLPAIPLTGTVTAVISPENLELASVAVEFAGSDLSGELDIHLSTPVSVTGNLRSNLLDLTPFANPPEESSEQSPDSNAPGDAPVETETGEQEFVFDDNPLPFDFLSAGHIDVEGFVDEFRQGPLHLDDLQATVKLEDATLNVESGFAVADGGSATASISLAANGNDADLDIDFDISDLRLSLSEASDRPDSDIPLIGLSADFQSSGASLRDIASNTNGRMLFTQGAGKIDNSAIGFFSNDIVAQLFGALNPFAKEEPYSIWECTVFALDIVDGVAEISPLLAQSDKLTIVAEGQIDLNDEHLDIRFNTKPRSGVGVSADMFVTPFIQLGGVLSAPRMELDKKGVIVSGGAAILTGGISFFVRGAADRASGATDRCAAALAIANGENVELE